MRARSLIIAMAVAVAGLVDGGSAAARRAKKSTKCRKRSATKNQRAFMSQFLKEQKRKQNYIAKHFKRLKKCAKLKDTRGFVRYAALKYRRGLKCKEHRKRHGCDAHCNQKHNQWHNKGLRPGCKLGCKAKHRWLPRLSKALLRNPFHAYIEANRAAYRRRARPLTRSEKKYLRRWFPKRLVNRVRVLVLKNTTGFFNYKAGATTYGSDFIIVKRGHRSNGLLKHEMVHVCQYDKYGIRGFAKRYAEQYVTSGFNYNQMTFEIEAAKFQKIPKNKTPHISRKLGYCR